MRSRMVGLMTALALTAACQSNPGQAVSESVRNEVSQGIQDAVSSWVAGVGHLDPGPFLDQVSAIRSYANDTMLYLGADSLTSLVHASMGSLRSANIEWIGDPVILVLGPNAGVFTCRLRATVTDTAGVTSSMSGVWTGVYQRIGGVWKMVAGHESYGQAATTGSM